MSYVNKFRTQTVMKDYIPYGKYFYKVSPEIHRLNVATDIDMNIATVYSFNDSIYTIDKAIAVIESEKRDRNNKAYKK